MNFVSQGYSCFVMNLRSHYKRRGKAEAQHLKAEYTGFRIQPTQGY